MNGQKTKEYIEKLCREKGLPYLDVRLYKGYEELFSYGVANGKLPTGKERLYLFSATKPMTVVCAMRLIEEGRLALDDLVESYLPAYKDAFLTDEKGNAVPTKNKMTVRHLLTMSGGLSYDVQTKPVQELMQKTGGKPTTEEGVNAFIKTPLSFEPGQRFQYSLCHDVLAAVIERRAANVFLSIWTRLFFSRSAWRIAGFIPKVKVCTTCTIAIPTGIYGRSSRITA